MKLTPVSDHIVVKAVSKEETSAAGIIIPDTVDKERPERGEVVAVGPGRVMENGSRSPMEVSVGQTVLFKKYAPDEVKVDGEEYLIIKMDDLMAVVE
ncbi:co-chaperone GroES [Candidatus Uhrbacteria bacterium CG_4_9_14_3_um_filter_50_9]|uniref:Co-chaperonin GroES n=1 Tax=Candidatus Uhrbacteria bacterium CG_4_9_14_3_um_filter_50_9 TaxID=1975035 RepID=A0A2M7XB74_9BACT|nr:MAG: co-chaperone GroES [Candidatus Uhrbacteria bacterium CG_4_9_14_3_um_filter_50_9]